MDTGWVYDDGGRKAAGFKGNAGDCVVRAVTIASGLPYQEVYDALADGSRTQRLTKRSKRKSGARDGVNVKRKWFRDYMEALGFRWTPTMHIGSGCKVHLCAEELPRGILIVAVSKHYTTMIDGVIRDTHDPRRETHCTEPYREPMPAGYWTHDNVSMHHIERRCVYGYWSRP
jgi:hypothetical protein